MLRPLDSSWCWFNYQDGHWCHSRVSSKLVIFVFTLFRADVSAWQFWLMLYVYVALCMSYSVLCLSDILLSSWACGSWISVIEPVVYCTCGQQSLLQTDPLWSVSYLPVRHIFGLIHCCRGKSISHFYQWCYHRGLKNLSLLGDFCCIYNFCNDFQILLIAVHGLYM